MSGVLLLEGCTTMITIPLTTEDLTKVRLAPSPLWKTVASSVKAKVAEFPYYEGG